MKFSLSTKPFSDALDLGVISANVSKFYQKSCLAQLTASRSELTINLEAAFVLTELKLKGSGDSDNPCSMFVDCLILKQLIHSLDNAVTTLEFTDTGLVVHSGSSKFTLPKLVEGDELTLTRPQNVTAQSAAIPVDKTDWEFIKGHQMYAVAMSFIHPVYTKVWMGDSGDVIVGDFDNSLFTFSKHSKLGSTCLVSDTIVNLFNTLPEGATLTKLDRSYRIDVKTDGFEYAAEFTPQYESDEGVGTYSADVILGMMNTDESKAIKVNVPTISKFLSQADLLSSSTEDAMKVSYHDGVLALSDANVDCKLNLSSNCPNFEVSFKTVLLKPFISNFDSDDLLLIPTFDEDGQAAGIICWTANMSAILGGLD